MQFTLKNPNNCDPAFQRMLQRRLRPPQMVPVAGDGVEKNNPDSSHATTGALETIASEGSTTRPPPPLQNTGKQWMCFPDYVPSTVYLSSQDQSLQLRKFILQPIAIPNNTADILGRAVGPSIFSQRTRFRWCLPFRSASSGAGRPSVIASTRINFW